MKLNSVMTEMTKPRFLPYFIITVLILGSFFLSGLTYLATKKTCRRTFIFPSAENGHYIIEYRNLSEKPHQGDINLFVDEILLGSTVERTKKLFTPGTRVISCFKRNGILYLNLSSELLQMGDGVVEIREGIDLLKTNIMHNFSGVNSVEVFIEGKASFEK